MTKEKMKNVEISTTHVYDVKQDIEMSGVNCKIRNVTIYQTWTSFMLKLWKTVL